MRDLIDDLDTPAAAIRLARSRAEGLSGTDADWRSDWTRGPTYGTRRETTWSEKRALVGAKYDAAKADIEARRQRRDTINRAMAVSGPEINALKKAKRELLSKPLSFIIGPEEFRIDRKIEQLIETANQTGRN